MLSDILQIAKRILLELRSYKLKYNQTEIRATQTCASIKYTGSRKNPSLLTKKYEERFCSPI